MSTRAERTKAIENLKNRFEQASGIYLTNYTGINVEKITQLRSDFREKGVQYGIVKNSLARIALEQLGKENLIPYLKGPIGVAFAADDPTAPAKIIKEFKKANKGLLEVKVASINQNLFETADVARLADIPSREVLLSQLLSCLKAPTTNLAGALNGILVKFAGTLDAVRKKKEEEAK
ncbi:MAG: 50S ribosomal protein L10 [Chitinivibrionales bacterium]|nr:50S ribosomal protein L10 [Chitinivibrionales bacterium]